MRANYPDETEAKAGVREVFRKESPGMRTVSKGYAQVRAKPPLLIGIVLIGVLIVFLLGLALGGEPDDVATAGTGDLFITVEQADQLRLQSEELQQTRSRLTIAEGEAAYLRSQVAGLTGDVEVLQSSFNEAQIEMGIIVAIYEECMARLYPVACVASARPRADAFLAELYATSP